MGERFTAEGWRRIEPIYDAILAHPFIRGLTDAIEVERQLHDSFLRDLGLSPEDVERTPIAPTNLAYTSYLLRVASAAPFHGARPTPCAGDGAVSPPKSSA